MLWKYSYKLFDNKVWEQEKERDESLKDGSILAADLKVIDKNPSTYMSKSPNSKLQQKI